MKDRKDRLEAIKRKDRDAWAAVYEEFADEVYRHAYFRLGGDRAAAQDVTQEVFVRAVESIRTFRGDETRLVHWLRGISRRIMARRARSLRPPPRFRRLLRSGVPAAASVALRGTPHQPRNPSRRRLRWGVLPCLHLPNGGASLAMPKSPDLISHARIIRLGILNLALALALTVASRIHHANLNTRQKLLEIEYRLARVAEETAKKQQRG